MSAAPVEPQGDPPGRPSAAARAVRRLWQPRQPLFWLVVALNLLSSAMSSALVVLQPQGALRAALTLFALLNTVAGWWLLARLWRDNAPEPVAAAPPDPLQPP